MLLLIAFPVTIKPTVPQSENPPEIEPETTEASEPQSENPLSADFYDGKYFFNRVLLTMRVQEMNFEGISISTIKLLCQCL